MKIVNDTDWQINLCAGTNLILYFVTLLTIKTAAFIIHKYDMLYEWPSSLHNYLLFTINIYFLNLITVNQCPRRFLKILICHTIWCLPANKKCKTSFIIRNLKALLGWQCEIFFLFCVIPNYTFMILMFWSITNCRIWSPT